MNLWLETTCVDPRAAALADRHYPRRGRPPRRTPRFVAPGEPFVLLSPAADAAWVALRQRPEFTDHAWPGAWICSLFRNESAVQSSRLVHAAVEATVRRWGPLPQPHGFITFVDPAATAKRRSRRALAGSCFLMAGWWPVAEIPASHGRPARVVLQLLPG